MELRLLGGARANAVVWGWGEQGFFSWVGDLWAEEAHSEQECRGPKPVQSLNPAHPECVPTTLEDKHKHLMRVQKSAALESLEMLFWLRVRASDLQVFMHLLQSQFVTCWL